jgi:hypothetical protein
VEPIELAMISLAVFAAPIRRLRAALAFMERLDEAMGWSRSSPLAGGSRGADGPTTQHVLLYRQSGERNQPCRATAAIRLRSRPGSEGKRRES